MLIILFHALHELKEFSAWPAFWEFGALDLKITSLLTSHYSAPASPQGKEGGATEITLFIVGLDQYI